mmetsp:Transcript_11073/g.26122  ORF Transcript_11073/g.26122 Transcript_11073/m.26122 type:complete len:129 (-) Transcript_11073:107-493(-)
MALRIAKPPFDPGFGNQGSWSHSSFSDELTGEPFFFLQRGIILASSFHYFTTSLTHSLSNCLNGSSSSPFGFVTRGERTDETAGDETALVEMHPTRRTSLAAKKIRDDSKRFEEPSQRRNKASRKTTH